MKKIKEIEVVPYNSLWITQFEVEASYLKEVLGEDCVAVHHVGSTSVPGLCAKPKIDIILVVRGHPSEARKRVEAIGFQYRGEYNIPMHYGFNKRETVDVNLHMYQEGHPEIELNLTFRDYLRQHPQVREEYASRKLKLLEDKTSFEKNNSPFTGYNLGKDSFIRSVLERAGFSRLRFVKCTHYAEWDFARKIRQQYPVEGVSTQDPQEWTFHHQDHEHCILCRGMAMVGYAHIHLESAARAVIRMIVVIEGERSQGVGRHFLIQIETWLRGRGYGDIHVVSSPDTRHFYEKMGYASVPFDDPKSVGDIFMSKSL